MHNYPTVSSKDELLKTINGSDKCPDIAPDEADRLIDMAERRAQLRGEESAVEKGVGTDPDCIISTDWTGFASGEFDYDNGHVNQFAMGVLKEEVSAEKNATLFHDTVVVQNGWLQTGDGRRSKVEEYHDEDFDKASPGSFWIPHGAQDYIAIIAISGEAIHGEPDLADAM